MSSYGSRDVEAGLPAETDTVWRVYSMTKPITSVAAMMLYEEGGFELTDPVSSYIPSFADVRVFAAARTCGRSPSRPPSRCGSGTCSTHTAGLTYGFHRVHPGWMPCTGPPVRMVRAPTHGPGAGVRHLGGRRVLFQPGAEWNYSMATDVLGRVIEVVSGQRLDEFFAARVLRPLGMTDTGFYAEEAQVRPGWPPCTRPGAAAPRSASTPWRRRPPPADHARRRRRPVFDRGGLSPVHPGHCCCTARTARPGNWTAPGC